MKKILKAIKNTIFGVVLVLPIFLIGYVMTEQFSGEIPSLFGYTTSIVITPSMSDVLPVGSIILSKTYTQGDELKEGDIITYLGEEGSFQGKLITHKIETITQSETDGTVIVTKGTQNTSADPAITPENVKSVMICRLINLGKFYQWIQNPIGFLLILVFPIMFIIAYEIWNFRRMIKKENTSEDNEKSNDEIVSQ